MTVNETVAAENGEVDDLEKHGKEIRQLCDKPLIKGDVWYLVDNHWFKSWQTYVGQGDDAQAQIVPIAPGPSQGPHPGPIDNSGLFYPNSDQLRDNMIDDSDFALVPELAWKQLKNRFGMAEGSQEVARTVIESGMFNKSTKVEVYQLDLILSLASNEEEKHNATFSRVDPFTKLLKAAKLLLKVPVDRTGTGFCCGTTRTGSR